MLHCSQSRGRDGGKTKDTLRRTKDDGRGDESCQSTKRMQANTDDKGARSNSGSHGERTSEGGAKAFSAFPLLFLLEMNFYFSFLLCCCQTARMHFFSLCAKASSTPVWDVLPSSGRLCRLLLSQSVAITSVKWRQKDGGGGKDNIQRRHRQSKNKQPPSSVCVWGKITKRKLKLK